MKLAVSAAAVALVSSVAASASAAPPWVDRPITLPRFDFAFDGGLGIGHADPGTSTTGVGFNLEGAFGITDRVEIGLRTGIRGGLDGKITGADFYGRPFDTETYGTNFANTFANPEVRVRGALVRHRILELALEGRAYLPFETGSHFGTLFGVPIALHLGHSVRLDTGAYIPVIFNEPVVVSLPAHLWIQASDKVFLGPLVGIKLEPSRGNTDFLVGFGLGYALASFIDLKTWFLVPDVNNSQSFGLGVGLQVRVE